MQRRSFGSLSAQVPVIGLGTWNIEKAGRSAAVTALRTGLDLGMQHIDTAEMYGMGRAEEIVGQAIAMRRDRVFLVSKVLPENASRKGTIAACEASLTRLGTDHLDCYLLHWRGRHPLDATFAAFEQLQRDGKILSWGVSNFDVADLEDFARLTGGIMPACNQVLYHLGVRGVEHAVIPWCERRGVAVVAYSPFGQSNFPAPRSPGGRVLARIAAAHKVSVRTVALAFLTRRGSVFAIPKAVGAAHQTENAAAGTLCLSDTEIGEIDVAFPLGPRPRTLPSI